jgi:hypothetical protein
MVSLSSVGVTGCLGGCKLSMRYSYRFGRKDKRNTLYCALMYYSVPPDKACKSTRLLNICLKQRVRMDMSSQGVLLIYICKL